MAALDKDSNPHTMKSTLEDAVPEEKTAPVTGKSEVDKNNKPNNVNSPSVDSKKLQTETAANEEKGEDRKKSEEETAPESSKGSRSSKLESKRLKEARELLRRSADGIDAANNNHNIKSRDTSDSRHRRSDDTNDSGGKRVRGRDEHRRKKRRSRSRDRSPSDRSSPSRSVTPSSRSRSRDSSSRSRSISPSSRSRSRSPYRRERRSSYHRDYGSRRNRRDRSRSSSYSRDRYSYKRRRRRSRSRSRYAHRRRSRRDRSRSSSYERYRYRDDRSRSRSRTPPRKSRRYNRSPSYSPSYSRGYGDSGRYKRDSPRRRERESRHHSYWSREDGYGGGNGRGSLSRRHDDLNLLPGERDLRTVFVTRLVPKVRDYDVRDFFSKAGKVRDVRLIMDRRSSRHKGAGYVEFFDKETAKAAVALSGGTICGFPVAVKPSLDEKTAAAASADYNGTGPSGNPGGVPVTSAVGWSRRPMRSVPDSGIRPPVGASDVGSATTPNKENNNNPPSKLVSVKELVTLLNPNNLPIQPIQRNNSNNNSNSYHRTGPPPPAVVHDQVPLPIAPGKIYGLFKRLYVGSVPFQLGESELHPIFEPFGEIASLQLQRDPTTGRSKGFGFVEYANHESAKKALAINGIEVAGRILKVAPASITAGGTAGGIGGTDVTGELDAGRDGLSMDESQKALLRERLARGKDFTSNGISPAGVPYNKALQSTHVPFKSLILCNMFDLATEQKGFEEELAEDVRDECVAKYGPVTHLHVDKLSKGLVYVRFDTIEAAKKAMISLNGRWFGGLRVTASYVTDDVYRKRFTNAPL